MLSETDPVQMRSDPYEFNLYYDCLSRARFVTALIVEPCLFASAAFVDCGGIGGEWREPAARLAGRMKDLIESAHGLELLATPKSALMPKSRES